MKRQLKLVARMIQGHHDMCNMEYVPSFLEVKDRQYFVGIRIVDIPHYAARTPEAFLQAFPVLYKASLTYLLEDATEILQGQDLPVTSFDHLNALEEFLKETN